MDSVPDEKPLSLKRAKAISIAPRLGLRGALSLSLKILLPILVLLALFPFFLSSFPFKKSATSTFEMASLGLTAEKFSHHFLENRNAGTILVVTGTVTHSASEPQSYFRVRAHLVDIEGKVVSESQVFAGNYLGEKDLKTLSLEEIYSFLSLKEGSDGANLKVPSQLPIPFMLVFHSLPKDITEYSVEISVGDSPWVKYPNFS
ncbi:MAG: DUF3426 domain-containing protein [Deltaproteobacteria bacterium]|nr:DUF3426 domain-containing protein [Deltaproteobacteria bacterium]